MEKEVKKYRLTDETRVQNGVTLHRVEYLRTLSAADGEAYVTPGQKGGWIEKERNLSHYDNCAVLGEAFVMGEAFVFGDACVAGAAVVKDRAEVWGNAEICDSALVAGWADISGDVRVGGHSIVTGGMLKGDFQLISEGIIIATPS